MSGLADCYDLGADKTHWNANKRDARSDALLEIDALAERVRLLELRQTRMAAELERRDEAEHEAEVAGWFGEDGSPLLRAEAEEYANAALARLHAVGA